MSNGLSQAEIDALLSGAASPPPEPDGGEPEASEAAATTPEAAAPAGEQPGPLSQSERDSLLTPLEKDAMGEIGNISMGTAATTLFQMLNRKVEITTPRVSIMTLQEIAQEYPIPFVGVEVEYTKGLDGTNILFLQTKDVKIITDLLMGGDGTNIADELSDLHLSAISEVMNQMIGSSSTSLAKLIDRPIDISPPRAYAVDLTRDISQVYPFSNNHTPIVRISFDMVIEGLINSEIMQVMPCEFAKEMSKSLLGDTTLVGQPSAPVSAAPAAPAPSPASPAPAAPPQPVPFAQPAPAPYQPAPYPPYPLYPPQPAPQGYYAPSPQPSPQPPPPQMVDVHAPHFLPFDQHAEGAQWQNENMELLLDVPLSITVELGKSKKYIKEILDFNLGTIVVLDKLAGEQIDILVNGKLIAKGEVVVIDENYGVRIKDIVSPSKRISQINP